MIIFGVGSTRKEIGRGKIRTTCIKCQEPTNINIFIIQRYAHAYWIPFFPSGKKIISECTNCEHLLEKKKLSRKILKRLQRDKVWHKNTYMDVYRTWHYWAYSYCNFRIQRTKLL